MVNLNVYGDIFNRYGWYEEPGIVVDVASLKNALDQSGEDTDVTLNIHTNGGSLYEGLAMYDLLRQSGKNIFVNVEGACHSTGVLLLLSAPIENRTASKNARFLVHNIRADAYDVTADDAQKMADMLSKETENMIRIYHERTGLDKKTCANLISSEIMHSADDMKQYGFIGKINSYISNYNNFNDMSKPKNGVNYFLGKLKSFQKSNPANRMTDPKNYEHEGENGEITLITTREDDIIEIGDSATLPLSEDQENGSTTLMNGVVVTVKDGVVEAIADSNVVSEQDLEELVLENEELKEDVENKNSEIERLKNQIEEITNRKNEAESLLEEAKNYITSEYVPKDRIGSRATTTSTNNRKRTGIDPVSIADEAKEAIENRRKNRAVFPRK